MSSPLTSTAPEVGFSRPLKCRIRVDFAGAGMPDQADKLIAADRKIHVPDGGFFKRGSGPVHMGEVPQFNHSIPPR